MHTHTHHLRKNLAMSWLWLEPNTKITTTFWMTFPGRPQGAQMTTLVPLRELLSWRNTLTLEPCSTQLRPTSAPTTRLRVYWWRCVSQRDRVYWWRCVSQRDCVGIDDSVCLNVTACVLMTVCVSTWLRVCSKETAKACGCRSDELDRQGCLSKK